MPQLLENPDKLIFTRRTTKAANYSAHGGETIVGNLKRGSDGKFTSGSAGDVNAIGGGLSASQQAAVNALGKPGGGKGKGGKKGGGKGAKPKKTDEQKRAEAEQKKAELARKKQENAAKIQDAQLGDDSEAFGFITDPNSDVTPNDLKPEYRQNLVDRGLLKANKDGTYSLTPEAKAYQKASEAGDEKRAAALLTRAKTNHDVREQAAQQAEAEKPKGGGGGGKGAAEKKPAATDVKAPKATPAAKPKAEAKPKGGGGGGGGGKQEPAKTGAAAANDDDKEALSFLDSDPTAQVKPEFAKQLVDKGLAKQDASGKLTITPEGKKVVDSMKAAASATKASLASFDVKKPSDRAQIPDSRFVFPDERAFPIKNRAYVKRAVSSWGRYKGKHSFEDFKRRLTTLARKLGYASELPKEWTEEKATDRAKVGQVMHEWKHGTLHSGSKKGPVVTNRRQAIAIALNQANKEGAHTGAMVAFMLPPDAANKLALATPDAEPANDLHLTLCYLGETNELPYTKEQAQSTIAQFAATQKPLSGEISGVGRFTSTNEGTDTSAFYASFDAPALPDFRQGLIAALKDAGIDYAANHGYTPHITLAYLPNSEPTPDIRPPTLKLTFDKVTLAWGDERFDILLGATKEVATSPAIYLGGPGGLASLPGMAGMTMNAQMLGKGDWVSWAKPGGQGRGRIVSVHKASTVPKTQTKLVGTADAPSYRVEVYTKDQEGQWQPTGQYVAHKADGLTKIKPLATTATKEAETTPALNSFSVFKQADGQYRWLTFSSSGYQDRDREIVPTSELEADAGRADNTGDYGPLLWWHVKSLKLGECDFNAMCGRVLVESGTFDLPQVAESLAPHLEELGTSIGFYFQSKEAGTYKGVRKFERSLLPALVASNPLTKVFIPNGDTQMPIADAEKRGWLARLLGSDSAVKQIEEAADAVQKQADNAGLAFKAKSDVMVEEKADGAATDPSAAAAADSTTPDDVTADPDAMMESPEEDAAEGGEDNEEYAADMTQQQLHDMLDQIMAAQAAKALEPLKAQLDKLMGQATKEQSATTALLEAFKEVTTLLADAIKENTEALKPLIEANKEQSGKVAKLEAQVGELTGEMPRAAKERASVAAATVTQAVAKEQQPQLDPDMEAIARIAGMIAGGNGGLLGQ